MGFALLLATAGGLSVANVYYAQPLLEQIGGALHVSAGSLGLTTGVTQLGYLVGLILLVPLGDLVDQRRLISWLTLVAGVGLAGAGFADGPVEFFAACAVVGLASAVVQVIVAYGAVLSPVEQRGRVIGVVTSGVVLGILLARTVSGLVAAALGWRAAFLLPAVLMVVMAVTVNRLLPRRRRAVAASVSYLRLISSVFTLTARDRVFRTRSLLALFLFGCFGALWGSVALPLSAAPWQLSTSQIGLFGIAGAAGALSASGAGRLADRGRAPVVTGVTLVLLLLSWAAIGAAPFSLTLLTLGIVVLDFAGQALHVTNQHLIVAGDPAATSRVIGGYMVYYSIGTGGGAIVATSLYSAYGWGAVCSFGAALAVLALVVWSLDLLPEATRGVRARGSHTGACATGNVGRNG
ncbi:major facilitator superfamily MFS_1 [Catenulispora acidiphila DSM 44928]|uniref:Major facilitator superfamily MFS_1 n=1 Tax=Catenulispora acidiphila (strain DSM 44928 / JCM 14897 / NBRC 102108 / NRRL B-24433 / ID139908) TaxID=479433 RepID=C7QIJ3_CATAD|nr:MFS transporter [Catenulispora acidiphila]ACU75070.1 major facilitator superfamily MFS_1 [Catenulispora acidiphila DSM 44928]